MRGLVAATLLVGALAACVPPTPVAVSFGAPTPGPIAAATQVAAQSTAAYQAAQSYAATGDAYNAQAMQLTADAQATWNALSVQQTQRAMQLTADAYTATADGQRARATQQAHETETQQAHDALSMQQAISATGTALAYGADILRAQAAAAQAQAEARAESETAWLELQRALIGMLQLVLTFAMLVVACGVVGVVIYYAIQRAEENKRHYHEQKIYELEAARVSAQRAQAEAITAMIATIDGKRYLPTPKGYQPMPILESVNESTQPVTASREHRWRAACKRLVYAAVELGQAGEARPFSERALTIRNPIVCHPDTGAPWTEGYRVLVGVLIGAGVLFARPGKTTEWGKDWTLDRFDREFDITPLPNLPDGEPPLVQITLRSPAVARSSAVLQSRILENESSDDNA